MSFQIAIMIILHGKKSSKIRWIVAAYDLNFLVLKPKYFDKNRSSNMDVDALTPCVARLLTDTILTIYSNRVLVSHEGGLQVPVPSQSGEMIDDASIFYDSWNIFSATRFVTIRGLINVTTHHTTKHFTTLTTNFVKQIRECIVSNEWITTFFVSWIWWTFVKNSKNQKQHPCCDTVIDKSITFLLCSKWRKK